MYLYNCTLTRNHIALLSVKYIVIIKLDYDVTPLKSKQWKPLLLLKTIKCSGFFSFSFTFLISTQMHCGMWHSQLYATFQICKPHDRTTFFSLDNRTRRTDSCSVLITKSVSLCETRADTYKHRNARCLWSGKDWHSGDLARPTPLGPGALLFGKAAVERHMTYTACLWHLLPSNV
jgi:hypothetical protein